MLCETFCMIFKQCRIPQRVNKTAKNDDVHHKIVAINRGWTTKVYRSTSSEAEIAHGN